MLSAAHNRRAYGCCTAAAYLILQLFCQFAGHSEALASSFEAILKPNKQL